MKFLSQLSQRKLYRIILCLVIAVFLLVNLCASMAGEKFDWKLDMTGEKLYEFSQITEDVGASLGEKTEIYVVAGEKDYPSMFKEVLSRYGKLSPNLTVAYMDPFENPLFVDHYKQQGYTLAENDVVVSGKNGIRQISYEEMLVYSGEEVSGINIEQQITGAILYVNSTDKPSVAFTAGHNERTSNALESVFENNNFQISSLSLASGFSGGEGKDKEASNADMIVIASPSKDFEDSEITALEQYMEAGGKLLVFIEPGVGQYPNLGGFLEKWNLALENNVIFEEKAFVSDNPINLIPMYGSHMINAYFVENPYYVVMPSARGIQVLKNAGDVKAQAVLTSTGDSYAKTKLQYDSAARESGDEKGPFVLAATAEKTVWSEEGEKTASLFLAGSRNIYADDIMSVETYANREFFTQVINYMTESVSSIHIPAKTLTKPPLPVTMQKSLLIGSVLVILLPLCLIAVGIVVYRKRKNL